MKIKFKYNYNMEFCLKTYSNLVISGEGEWNIDEIDLAKEYCESDYESPIDFIENYFWIELSIDPDYFIFDSDDIKLLNEFLKHYKTENTYEN